MLTTTSSATSSAEVHTARSESRDLKVERCVVAALSTEQVARLAALILLEFLVQLLRFSEARAY
jgi:hypothetical protein